MSWTFEIVGIQHEYKDSELPDGTYHGIMGAYICTIIHEDKVYKVKTKEGVKGIRYKAIVKIKDGKGTVTF